MNSKKATLNWLSLGAALVLLLTTAGIAQAQGGMITGTVTSPGGYPLPAGTRAKLFEPGGWDAFGQAVVDVDTGAFSLGPVTNGLYVLKAVPPADSGYTQSEPVPVSVFNGPVDVGVVALTEPEIYGIVTEPDGTTPVPAEVRVYAGNSTLVQWVEAPAGEFLIGGLPAGGYSLKASPVTDDPYWHSPLKPVTVNGYTQTVTLTLTAADIYGIVTDHLGQPVSNATVRATEMNGGYRSRHDQTSSSGYYAIGDLEDGTYILTARPPWYEGALLPPVPVTVTLPPTPQEHDLAFRAPPKVVTGTVETNTGDPVQDAQVVAHRLDKGGRVKTLSGADGGYQLDLADGLWALTVKVISTTMPSEWVYPNPSQLVHFKHNAEPEHKQVDFTVLTADAHVTGAVELPGGGVPTFTVTVSLHNDEGIGARTVITADGTFDIAIPNGGYKVWATPDDTGYMGPVVEPIQVPPNTTFDLGTLTLLERDAAITGTVTDKDGVGLADIPVSAWRPGAPGGAEGVTGPDGQYVLSVVAGEWHVQPSPGPDQPYIYTGPGARVTISSAETIGGVDFSLVTADATIEGYLVDEEGNPVTDAEGWASATHVVTPTLHNGAPIQAGTFSISVPGGTYYVAAHLPAGSLYMSAGERAVAVAAAETVSVTLTVKEKDARIVGGLWDPRNQDVVEGVNAGVLAWAGGNWVRTPIDPGNGTYTMSVASGLWHLGYRVDPQSDYVGLRHHKNVPVASGQTVPVPLPVAERDGLITGTVLGPDGAPLAGAKVIADGIGPVVTNLWLSTHSGEDGSFRLAVPHGYYHLGATIGVTDSIKPALRHVYVPPDGVSGDHVLQFRWPDAVISGTVSISPTAGITGTVLIWGWAEDDAFVHTRVPVTGSVGSYSLDVISNTTWHLGAVYETESQYWLAQEEVVLGAGDATQDLVLTGPHPKPAPVAVTFDASQPQRILLADGAHIYIPAGAMPVEGLVTLHVVPIATLPHQRHANVYRYGYAFTAVDEEGQPITEHFNQEVVIGFAYDERELWAAGISEHLLKPAYFSTTTNEWTFPESYVVDNEGNRVVMQIDHFTDFALTGEPGFRVFLPLVVR
ncbi:MAG: carboxypeptidase-like regulatory domain-containing protein [Chloroflexota bacterium]|nr:carboxypeptidase-like regulatory domain-containing protein [Chloroflexota bacterium]